VNPIHPDPDLSPLGPRILPLVAAACVAAFGASCGGETEAAKAAAGEYEATVRWTEGGVPHIEGKTFGDAGFGSGYAFATLDICTLADQIVKVNSRRSRFFGRGDKDAHLESDFMQLFLQTRARAEAGWPALAADVQELLRGFAAGYNARLAEVGPSGLPKRCRGAEWVAPIDHLDLLTYYNDLSLVASSRALPQLGPVVLWARPPKVTTAVEPSRCPLLAATAMPGREAPSAASWRGADELGVGSNGVAIGKERSANGRGLVLGNPHFPWQGELRFWQLHVKVPGKYDVGGAGLFGSPIPNLGFNPSLAWTHTVSKSSKFTAYRLKLAPGDPTSYLHDGKPRKMTDHVYSVQARRTDGTLETVARTYYRSHYGPIVAIASLGEWTDTTAYTLRDANANNGRLIEHFLRVGQARSVAELDQVMQGVQANPWVNTIAADKDGNAFYAESNSVPNLSKATYAAHAEAVASGDMLATILGGFGFYVLDGSTARDEWQVDGGSREPGLVPWSQTPHTTSTDYLVNANESYWMCNAAKLLTGYAAIFGGEDKALSPRTRMTVRHVVETGPDAAAGADGKFTPAELATVITSNRDFTADLLMPDVVGLCAEVTSVTVGGATVLLDEACKVLLAWDRRDGLASKGTHLWREFVSAFFLATGEVPDYDGMCAKGYDPADPIGTPAQLRWKTPKGGKGPAVVALGEAVARLKGAGIPLDAPLAAWQFASKGGDKVAVPGGLQKAGCFNIASWSGGRHTTLLDEPGQPPVVNSATGLTKEGYAVNYGSSFVMAVGFGDNGPEGLQVLTYSQSAEPDSPHFRDQTDLYAAGKWLPIRFRPEDIAADPKLTTKVVRGKKP